MKIMGPNIKRLRQAKGYSLKTFAEKVGVSASFISQVETGKINPSLSKLKDISDTLNTTIGLLIGENDQPHTSNSSPIVRKNERKHIDNLGTGINIYLLTSSDPNKQMEPLYIKLQQNASSGERQYQHFGQEFVLVLKGKIEIILNETKYILNIGDSIYFNSSTPHSFKNLDEEASEVVWVDTPPSL
jgi:transcriptional regulator with XRE-family HTH domain